jgi:hypothetical protein
MSYTLPLENQLLPDYRIIWRQGFGAGSGAADNKAKSASGGWGIIPLQRRGIREHGFYLKFFERVAFPQVGRAAFAYAYGQFDDTTVDAVDLPELRNAEVRIQVSAKGEAAWRTVYWGTIDYVEDSGSPGAIVPRGERVFHCVDGFYRTKRWLMDRHGFYASGGANYGVASSGDAIGNPGYNWSAHHDSVVAGNMGSSQYLTRAGSSVYFHTPAGAGTKWTDKQAVEHALSASRPPSAPEFTLSGATDLLDGTNSWDVGPNESVLDFVFKILKRERGRGLCYVDWDDDSGAPSGALTVKLTIGAQLAADVFYISNPDTGALGTLQGATNRGTATTVDLTGDHRCVSGSLELGDPDQFRLDYLETEGENIEVLATLSYQDGSLGTGSGIDGRALTRGWSATDQASFVALTAVRRQEAKWKPVFQLHSLNPAWGGYAGDGNGGELTRIDYRCTKLGRAVTPDTATTAEKGDPIVGTATSPLLVEILPDLPLFEAYTYASAPPVRVDGAAETVNAQRRKMMCYVRVAAGRFLDVDQTASGSVHLSVDYNSIWAIHSGDEGAGTRFFSTASPSNLSSVYDYSKLVFTVALKLPHRVRFASGDEGTTGKRGKIHIAGSHFWLASPGAIYDLDTSTTSSGGYAARRNAVGASTQAPGILRDDRVGLAAIHALAWAWFGSTSTHRSASWSLKACGFLPSYSAYSGAAASGTPADVSYPTIGQVVTTLTANGTETTLNTPVTRVHYDAEKAVTSWSTEWHDLETK